MILNRSLTIRRLESADASAVSNLMISQSEEYLRFFYAFSSDLSTIAELLADDKQDVYSGVFWQGQLIGIFMLRGWDEGYEIPSFGVLIDEEFRGQDLLNLTVNFAKMTCKLAGINRYMVKIHPKNTPLKNVQRMGFYQAGAEESTGNVIFYLDF